MQPFRITVCFSIFLALSSTTSVAQEAPKPYAPTDAIGQKSSAKEIAAVKVMVRATLKDPDSAKFGVIRFYKALTGTVFACGTVNAKNSYGGYTGSVPFAASHAFGAISEDVSDEAGQSAFQTLFPKCAGLTSSD